MSDRKQQSVTSVVDAGSTDFRDISVASTERVSHTTSSVASTSVSSVVFVGLQTVVATYATGKGLRMSSLELSYDASEMQRKMANLIANKALSTSQKTDLVME